MKPVEIVAGAYREGAITIPYTRLREMIRKNDIIQGMYACLISGPHVGYKVTHVDWWGVYAVPTDEMLQYYPHTKRRHYKFKWQNIQGICFTA